MMTKRIACVFALVFALAAVATVSEAAPVVLPPVSYLGAFFSPGPSSGSTGYGGLAYYNDGVNPEVLYTVGNWDQVGIITIPTPVIPNVGWTNLNTAVNQGTFDFGSTPRTWGVRVRNDGGTDHVYVVGSGGAADTGRVNTDLTGNTFMGNEPGSNESGLSPVPAGFVAAAGVDAARDTLSISRHFSAPQLYLNAPQLGDGTSVPGQRVFLPSNYSTNPPWNFAYSSVEWVQPLATSDWKDGFIVMGEQERTTKQLVLAFLDPQQVAAIGLAGGTGAFDNADITRFDMTPYLSPGVDTADGLIGMGYDPATGRLFVAEDSSTPGIGTGDAVVHVFQIGVPEPATMGLLAVGACGLLRLRKRRK